MKEAKRYVIRNSYDGKFYNSKNTFKPKIHRRGRIFAKDVLRQGIQKRVIE